MPTRSRRPILQKDFQDRPFGQIKVGTANQCKGEHHALRPAHLCGSRSPRPSKRSSSNVTATRQAPKVFARIVEGAGRGLALAREACDLKKLRVLFAWRTALFAKRLKGRLQRCCRRADQVEGICDHREAEFC